MWQELGIAPTEDEKAIRRAYARRLHAIGGDRDPIAFQRLRRAYEAALVGARVRSERPHRPEIGARAGRQSGPLMMGSSS